MYLRRFTVDSVRSVSKFEMEFKAGEETGWHVILGSNGTGKSTIVKSFALIMMGEKEAYASRQDFSRWIRSGESKCNIEAQVSADSHYDDLTGKGPASKRLITLAVSMERLSVEGSQSIDIRFSGTRHMRTVWGGGGGWFSASFGPFRRFTGGDNKYDRLFVTNKRLAPHLTALGEDVALTDAMLWLSTAYLQTLQDEKNMTVSAWTGLLGAVTNFLNESHFLPDNAVVSRIDGSTVNVRDGNGVEVSIDQLSDGYRSALSLVLELIRQMVELYGLARMTAALSQVPGTVQAPGVVVIDEIDVHLHPTWQRTVGQWLTKCFPKVQFIVTTHSPIVCRAVADETGAIKGSVWKLPTPGTNEKFLKVQDTMLNQLVFGNVIDAYSTELFGKNIIRSKEGEEKIQRLADLNTKSLLSELSSDEEVERKKLRQAFPGEAGIFGMHDA